MEADRLLSRNGCSSNSNDHGEQLDITAISVSYLVDEWNEWVNMSLAQSPSIYAWILLHLLSSCHPAKDPVEGLMIDLVWGPWAGARALFENATSTAKVSKQSWARPSGCNALLAYLQGSDEHRASGVRVLARGRQRKTARAMQLRVCNSTGDNQRDTTSLAASRL